MHRPARHPVTMTTVATALAATLVTSSCTGPGQTAAPTPSPSATAATSAPSPTASAPQVTATSGAVELAITVPGSTPTDPRVEIGTDAPRATWIEVDLPAPDEAPAVVDLLTPGSLDVDRDGSATIRSDDGTPVGGLTAPDGGARFTAAGPDRLELRSAPDSGEHDTTASTAPPATRVTLGTHGVVSADWGEREGGRSLAVDPTAWARAAGGAGVDLVWAELVAADPEVDTSTMHDQLVCHSVGAPDKATWNLEPWRPDVGLLTVLAQRCNPTE